MILVSPAEPKEFYGLGRSSSLPEKFGADFMFGSKLGLVGVQRKKFPEDFLASLRGGDRVARELSDMKRLAIGFWVLEGLGNWTSEGYLIYGGRYKYYQNEYWGFILTLQAYLGYPVLVTQNSPETYRLIEQIYNWSNKDDHGSLFARPKPKTADEWANFFLQGIPGVGRGTAGKILEHYGGLPVVLDPVTEDLQKVVGPKKAEIIRRHLKGLGGI